MSPLVAAWPELKRLWIRVLKRVHPDLAVDEQDMRRCERLTQQANDAYTRRDEVALRAVLELKGPPPPRHAPPDPSAQAQQATPPQLGYQPTLMPHQPPIVSGREAVGILWAACAVLYLLLYGIFAALRETVGRNTSLTILVLLTAAALWLITRNSKLTYNHKARWVAAVAIGMVLVGICLLDSHPRANPLFPSARASTARTLDSGNPPPSRWYWDVIKTKVGESWNPSGVAATPAGATAEIAFTISQDGTSRDVRLRRPSGYPSLDSSCILAVQQVKTFGPPEGGARNSLNVLYPCSYNELALMNAHLRQSNAPQKNATPKPEPGQGHGAQLGAYIEAAKSKVAQKWNLPEIAGSTPAGATVYIQFAIRRRGNHGSPTMETSSGSSSLDASCLAAVDQIKSFDHLPRSYDGDSLTVLYHCTYPGSLPGSLPGSPAKPSAQHPVEPQQPTNDTVVTN